MPMQKTIGAMIEADMFCLVGAVFASFASLVATQSFWFFEIQPGWKWLADSLVLSWLALAMMVIAWSKLWVGKPTFGSGKHSFPYFRVSTKIIVSL